MQSTVVYQVNTEDLKSFLNEELVAKELNSFLSQFKNVFVTPEEVAHFHGVSKQTVYNYVKEGALIPEQREKDGSSIRFRLSEALKIDFRDLQKQSRIKLKI